MLKNYPKLVLNFKMIILIIFMFTFSSLSFGQIAQRGTATTATSTNNTITINKPTGVIAGDIMIVNITSSDNNSLGGNDANLAGWNLIDGVNINGNTRRISILYKIAGAGEPGNYVFNVPNGTFTTDNTVGAIIAFSGVSNSIPFDVTPGTLNGTNNSPAIANAISNVTANSAIVMLGADENNRTWSNWVTTDPATLTELYDTSNSVSIGAAWAIKTSIGSTGNGGSTLSGNGRTQSILLALRPAPRITGLVGSPVCPGGNITINGENLSGATSVTIGGTPVTSITTNTATQIVVVPGSGTNGNVVVTTPSGTATSAGTVSFNTAPTVTLTSAAGTNNQNVCINTLLTTIRYSISGGGATGATVSGLPAGVSGLYLAGTFTIAGTPTASGTFNYTVSTTGGTCVTTATGTIIVTSAAPTITTNPSNSTIATGANTSFTAVASNSPSSYTWEVSTNGGGSWSTVTNGGVYSNATTATLNITAAPFSMNGYIYRVRATNGCGTSANSSNATLTVTYCAPSIGAAYPASIYYIKTVNFIGNLTNSNNTSTSSSSPNGYQDQTGLGPRASQAQGEGVNIFVDNQLGTNPVYMKAWIDWDKDGIFSDVTEIVYQCTNAFVNTTFGFQIPAGTTPGNYRIRLRTNRAISAADNTFTSCGNIDNYGETEDYLFTVVANCAAKIVSKVDGSNCGTGTVTLSATGTAGTTSLNWYTSGGVFITNTPTTGQTASWTTPSISTTTNYYVTASNGTCESLFKTLVTATIKPVAALSFSNANPEICGEDEKIQLTANGTNEQIYLIDESFESGLGVFSNNQIASPNGSITNWQSRTSTYVPSYPAFPVWYPAISSGFGTNKFVMSTSDIVTGGTTAGKVNEALELASTVNTVGFLNLNLTFNIYFSSYLDSNNAANEGVFVEYKNGAGAWTAVADTNGTILTDQGIGTQFVSKTINLNPQIGITNLKIRIRYRAGWCDGVAIDDVKLFGDKPLTPNFTWTGSPVAAFTDAACTNPYVAGTTLASPDIWIKPTLTQLETGSYSFTANANLANGCTTSATINVTNKSKVWKGTTNNDWNIASNWLPVGVPTANDCVIISTGTTSQIMNTPNALAKNLKVKGTGILELQSSRNLTVTDWVNVESGATFNIRNSANLVQVTPTPSPANSGNINMERTAYIDFRDYVYWSSPVANFNSANISTYSNNANLYKWIPTTGAVNGFGNWTSGVETMVLGAGYIERGLNNAPLNSPVNFTSTFTGVPNNGSITTPISRGTYSGVNYATGVSTTPATDDDDNWNLLGNPYPSAISAADFLNANSTNLDGFVKIWTHGIAPSTSASDPFYNNYGYNYDPNDYITWNLSGPSTPGFSGFIGAGQGFITKMKHTSPTTSSTAVFNNTMRNETHTNSEFYKAANNERAAIGNNEGHIWIDLVSSSASTRSLIAYVNGATNDKDQMYDAQSDMKSNFRINSLLGAERFIIQGRTTPFNPNDQVNLAFSTPTNGTYNIAIGAVDGLFEDQSQNIYLEDKQLNIIHDLRSAPYQFTTTQGENIDRFVLRYTNQTLSNDAFDYNNSVLVYANENINIKSSLENIRDIKIYDVLGKTLLSKNKVGKNEIVLTELKPTSGLVIVKIILDNGSEITKKIIF